MRKVKSPAVKTSSKDVEFGSIMYRAAQAANEAGDKWVAEHTKPAWAVVDSFTGKVVSQMLDVCGIVYIRVGDKRGAFAKWLNKAYGYNNTVRVNHKYRMRQEWSLGEVCEGAALKVLREAGINGLHLYSNID